MFCKKWSRGSCPDPDPYKQSPAGHVCFCLYKPTMSAEFPIEKLVYLHFYFLSSTHYKLKCNMQSLINNAEETLILKNICFYDMNYRENIEKICKTFKETF